LEKLCRFHGQQGKQISEFLTKLAKEELLDTVKAEQLAQTLLTAHHEVTTNEEIVW